MGRLGSPPPPRLVDWTLLGLFAVALATGGLGLVTGTPEGAWVFALHGVAGLLVVVPLAWKLRRVRPRLARPREWDRAAVGAVVATLLVLVTLGTGVLWVSGGDLQVGIWNALVLHGVAGVLVGLPLVVHLLARFRLPERSDLGDRRIALQYALLAAGGLVAWRLQQAAVRALDTASAGRRFTGSRERASDAGNAFPTTSWVADDPDPVDPGAWTLTVDGAVAEPVALGGDDLDSSSEERALLDCTSGWYSVQDWQGVRVDDLLDAAGVDAEARYVAFHSVTGYRWSLPLAEAREALLATHVGGERLSHGHGFPLRLVAPGRRGFQWVKWVERVEVRTAPDYGQWVAIFTSGFD